MRFPKMREGAQYRVTVPALNGGVNLKDAPNLVEDNQLTDVKNMWWKDQALRTRPGLYTDEGNVFTLCSNDMTDFFYYKIYPPVRVYEGQDVFDYVACFSINEGSRMRSYLDIYCFDENGRKVDVCGLSFELGGWDENDPPYAKYALLFVADKKDDYNGLYVLLDNGWIYRMKKVENAYTVKRTLERVPPTEIYAPLIMVNGKGGNTENGTVNGTLFEGYNLLTGAFRAAFTTDGTSSMFKLPQDHLTTSTGENTQIDFTQSSGDVVHWEIVAPANTATATVGGVLVTAKIDYTGGKVTFSKSSGESFPLPSTGANNSLIITAWKTDTASYEKIVDMSITTWFGGDRSGHNGGTRMFVSGNTSKPNLVHWSDVNNPLYFPENNYAYIGDSAQRVVGFGKQNDMLVIFKNHEIYYTTYVAGASYTAEDVISGKIVDVTANSAVFPITPLHSSIGCDCPRTIQLCNNRLIWATSDGHVYGLTAANQYGERNVRELSANLNKRLSSYSRSDLQQATSGDYNGLYMLFVQNQVYLLDYMDSMFQYYSSYSDERKAQRRMPWYIWELPENMEIVAVLSGLNTLSLIATKLKLSWNEIGFYNQKLVGICYRLEGTLDSTVSDEYATNQITRTNVHSMFQTKVFDFGRPDRRKFIRRLHIGATDTEEKYISLSYITEDGVQADAYRIGVHGDGKMREWSITPGVSRVRQFGIRAESSGNMAVDNMVLKYEVNGEVR